MDGKKLVIGASGFLGSHVTRQLVARGEDVRVLVRKTSSTRGFDDLPVERHYGDIFDLDAVRAAMSGCDVVFYCVVDTRAWLRDSTPLWRTNVYGLRGVLAVARQHDLHRFVFTSTVATIGLSRREKATEELVNDWADRGGDYVRSRVMAEDLVLRYAVERGLPGVAMCVSTTYGPRDWQPTPQGAMVAAAIRGKLPFYVEGSATEVVGVEDAAQALILAGDVGRIANRYIISERFMDTREIFEIACAAVGTEPPRRGLPLWAAYAMSAVSATQARLRGKDARLSPLTLRLAHIMSPMDHSKAVRELGWRPAPATQAIAEAACFFADRSATAGRPERLERPGRPHAAE